MAGEGKGIRSSGAVPPVASRPALTRAELESLARDVAIRVAGANHGRRLYGQRGQGWARTLAAVMEPLGALFEAGAQEVTLALLGDGLAVQGLPVTQPPSAVVRFVGQHRVQLDVGEQFHQPGGQPNARPEKAQTEGMRGGDVQKNDLPGGKAMFGQQVY